MRESTTALGRATASGFNAGGRRLWRALGLAAIGLTLALGSPARADEPSAALAQKAPEAGDLLASIARDGHVRVIVQVGMADLNQSAFQSADGIASVKSAVATVLDPVIADHLGATTQNNGVGDSHRLRRMEVNPIFALTVTASELESLAADPRIAAISVNHVSVPLLIDSVPLIGMNNAYANGGTGLGSAVAILDSGIVPHEFLANGKVALEACFSSHDGGTLTSLCPNGTDVQTGPGSSSATVSNCTGIINNLCAHGPHIAGIAAGFNTGQSAGEPPSGVARDSRIVSVQVFSRQTDFFTCVINGGDVPPCILSYEDDQIAALDWLQVNALDLGGGVRLAAVNLSIGTGSHQNSCDDDPRKGPVDKLRAAGVATVAAAGNSYQTNAVTEPACISTVVSVASSTKDDHVSCFSNISDHVDLLAPGGFAGGLANTNPISCNNGTSGADILSSVPPGPGTYNTMFGTSMAAAHVTGAIAAIRSACPDIPYNEVGVKQIVDALTTTGKLIADDRPGGTVTKPRIQVDAAIEPACNPPPAPTVAFAPVGVLALALLALGERARRRRAA